MQKFALVSVVLLVALAACQNEQQFVDMDNGVQCQIVEPNIEISDAPPEIQFMINEWAGKPQPDDLDVITNEDGRPLVTEASRGAWTLECEIGNQPAVSITALVGTPPFKLVEPNEHRGWDVTVSSTSVPIERQP